MRLIAPAAVLVGTALTAAVQSPAAHAQTANIQNSAPPAAKVVTVEPGQTLSGIAAANGTTYVRLFDANSIINDPDLIYPKEQIRVPNAGEQLPDRPLPAEAPAAEAAPAEPASPAPSPTAAAASTPPAATSQPQNVSTPVATAQNAGVWDRLAACESSGNWAADTGNGFYGGLQFTPSSWHAVGGEGYPNQASKAEQIARAEQLQAIQGWGAWPACSAKIGL